MKNIFFFIILSFPFFLFAQRKVDVIYIANEGFLIESQDKKIVIDGLFDRIDGDWCDSPSEEMLEKMRNAEAPFDDIDLIAVTHNHRDHFNGELILQHLLSNTKGVLLCPDQAYSVLKELNEFNRVKERIIPVTPPLYSDSNMVISGMNIRVIRLEHSHYEEVNPETGAVYNKHQNIENLGFVIEIDDTKLFHCGDTNPKNQNEYQTFQLQNEEIDIAFLERQFVNAYGSQCMKKINEMIAPEYVFLMHIRPANKDYFFSVLKDIPSVFVNKEKMETVQIFLDE